MTVLARPSRLTASAPAVEVVNPAFGRTVGGAIVIVVVISVVIAGAAWTPVT